MDHERAPAPPLSALDADELLWRQFENDFCLVEGSFPSHTLQQLTERRARMEPRLLAELERAARPEPDSVPTLVPLVAAFVLASWRCQAAWRPLLQWARLPEVDLEELMGDSLTEDFPALLASVCDGDMAPALDLLADPGMLIWCRTAVLDAWALRVDLGLAPLQPLEQAVLSLGAAEAARLSASGRVTGPMGEHELLDHMVGTALDTASPALREAALGWMQQGLVDKQFVDEAYFHVAFAEATAKRAAGERLLRTALVSDLGSAIGWWWDAAAREQQQFLQEHTPYVRAEPKVGRNDPCPCGSGKKFKKCHGAPA